MPGKQNPLKNVSCYAVVKKQVAWIKVEKTSVFAHYILIATTNLFQPLTM